MGVMSTLESNAAVLQSINHSVATKLAASCSCSAAETAATATAAGVALETIATYCLESATQLRATPCISLLMPQ